DVYVYHKSFQRADLLTARLLPTETRFAGARGFYGPLVEILTSDFDGDGHLDLAGISADDAELHIHFGDGNGNLQAAASVTVGEGPNTTDSADFDGNGTQDIVVANRGSDTATVVLIGTDRNFRTETVNVSSRPSDIVA